MTKKLSFLFSVLILSFAFGYFIFAWTEPGSAPPGGNVPAPLNVGSTAQTKSGNLTLPNLYLGAGGNEGNIYGADIIQGYNDLRLFGNSAKTATIWLDSPTTVTKDFTAQSGVILGGVRRTTWPGETNLNGWSFGNDYLYDDGEEVIRASDEWLRLNQSGHFASGVYTPGRIRADNGLYVSDDERIYRCGEDYVCTDDNFMVTGGGWLRVDGSEGLYFQSYGGGWRMTDSTWIRSYGGKRVYVDNIVRADGGFQVDGTTVIGGDAWVEGDRIRQNTIDGSEIQDNTLTASDLAANSCGNSELIDNPTFNNVNVNGTLRLSWQRIQQACMTRMCKATCPSGYIVVGGGCEMHGGTAMDNRPEYIGYSYWDRRWVCYGRSDSSEDRVETTYAICLRIQQP